VEHLQRRICFVKYVKLDHRNYETLHIISYFQLKLTDNSVFVLLPSPHRFETKATEAETASDGATKPHNYNSYGNRDNPSNSIKIIHL
jgi:hypothetical protein